MIIQTKKQIHTVQTNIYLRPVNNENLGISSRGAGGQGGEAYSHRQPILGFGQNNQKRFSDYNINVKLSNNDCYKNNNKEQDNWEIHSDMTQSRLSKINQELQSRTNYYSKYGKYDSKWADSHLQKFPHNNAREHYQRELSVRSSGQQNRSESTTPNRYELRQPYQFITTQRQSPPIYVNSKPVHHSNFSPQPQNYTLPQQTYHPQQSYIPQSYSSSPQAQNYTIPTHQYSLSPLTKQHPTFNPRNSQYSSQSEQDEQRFYDFEDPKDALRYQAHEMKEVTKDQARQVKEQVKDNVRQNVQDVVGADNYYLMRDIKHNVGQIADNALYGVKEDVRAVADTAKVAKDVVVDGAREAKDHIKEGTKEAVKGAVGQQNFNLMKYIKDATSQITKNVFGASSSFKKSGEGSQVVQRANNERVVNNGRYMKNESLKEVSPIEYSQRSFSQAPSDQFGFFWIYGLIAIGFFLVLFQALK